MPDENWQTSVVLENKGDREFRSDDENVRYTGQAFDLGDVTAPVLTENHKGEEERRWSRHTAEAAEENALRALGI